MDDNKYFYRVVPFKREGEQLALVDVLHPGADSPLDPWLGTVISLADGQHTLQELRVYLAVPVNEQDKSPFREHLSQGQSR